MAEDPTVANLGKVDRIAVLMLDVQVDDGRMDGFVTSFAETLRSRGAEDHDPSAVMGYYGAAEVPVPNYVGARAARELHRLGHPRHRP